MTFKERVASVAIAQAPLFKSVFIDQEYLICSDAFTVNDYYILGAHEDNYQHLVGVNTPCLSPEDFFQRCLSGALTEADIDFHKPGRTEGEIKGSVRKKIKELPSYTSMMGKELVAQENFLRNKVMCSIAATDHSMTIGYINNSVAVPKSLLNGDRLDRNKACRIDLILKRPAGTPLFSGLVFGDKEAIEKYRGKIEAIVEPHLLQSREIQ